MDINLGLSAVATGTVDVITATYSPAPTLVDKKILFLRAIGANTSTTPTFAPNGLAAKVITKLGGTALESGDISGAGFVALLMYESANNRWVLLNPKISFTPTLAQVLVAANLVPNGVPIKSADSNVYIDFGNGNYIGITTDNNGYSSAFLYLDRPADYGQLGDANFSYFFGAGASVPISNYIHGYLSALTLNHGTILNIDSPVINFPQLTASRFVVTDASKNIDTKTNAQVLSDIGAQPLHAVLTALAALGATAFGTSAGTFCQGNDSRLSDARGRKYYNYINTDQPYTGTTGETIIEDGLLISSGAMGANSRLQMECQIKAVGTAGTKTFRFYLNTSANTLAGATQIGAIQLIATAISGGFERRIVNKNSVSLNEIYPPTTSSTTDLTMQNAAFSTLNWDFSVNTYLIVTVQLANSADTGILANMQLYIDAP